MDLVDMFEPNPSGAVLAPHNSSKLLIFGPDVAVPVHSYDDGAIDDNPSLEFPQRLRPTTSLPGIHRSHAAAAFDDPNLFSFQMAGGDATSNCSTNCSWSAMSLAGNGTGWAGFGIPMDAWDLQFQQILTILHVYVLPVIILIGIVGNTLSFLVYIGTPRLYRQSSSLYLAFLAAVDNVSLVFIFVVWFSWVGVHLFHKKGWCQTTFYCTYVCSFLSAWTVVSFTCERWIVVFHPLKRHRLCTRRRAIVVMTSLTIGSMLFYSISLFTTGVEYADNMMPICVQLRQYRGPAMQVFLSIDTMLIVVVPMFAIFVMNAAIGIKICHYTGRDPTERCTAALLAGSTAHGFAETAMDGIGRAGSPPCRAPSGQYRQRCPGATNSAPEEAAYSNCSASAGCCRAVGGQLRYSRQQHQKKYAMHELPRPAAAIVATPGATNGNGNMPTGFQLTLQLQPPLQSSSCAAVTSGQVVGKGSTLMASGGAQQGCGGVPTSQCVTSGNMAIVGAAAMTATATGGAASMTNQSAAGCSTSAARSWRILTRQQHTQLRITRGLLVVSTVFVALNLPSYAFRIQAFIIGLKNEPYEMSTWHAYIWQELIQILYYSNFSSRFFLYCACSRNFRYAVHRLACRRRPRACAVGAGCRT